MNPTSDGKNQGEIPIETNGHSIASELRKQICPALDDLNFALTILTERFFAPLIFCVSAL